jgi:hypothetical protein
MVDTITIGHIVMEWDVTLSTLGSSGQGQRPLVSCCKHDTEFGRSVKTEDVLYLPIYLGAEKQNSFFSILTL